MPSPTTVLQIGYDALYLSRAVGVDQTLTAQEGADVLRAFNDQLENFSTQKLAVYGLANQTFNTVANQKVYTIGPSGDFNTTRPIRIGNYAYSSLPVGASQPVTYPCAQITQEEYNLIAVKDQTQEYPNVFLYVNTYPLGTITFWPVPSQVTPVTFSIDRVLTQATTLGATISFPPGYVEAFKYNLAVRLAPLWGAQITQDVKDQAKQYLADIKRANKVTPVLQYDPALCRGEGYGSGRWY
jgi:hypothetical protein